MLDFPAWEDFPLKNYWELGYSHGPLSNKKYLPMLTSRGCPYPCNFCVIPKTNERKWRSRTPKNVLDEIKFWQKKLGVKEFHFEDLNPTVNDKRTKEFCNLIIKQNINVIIGVVGLFHALHKINRSTFENYLEIFIKTKMNILKIVKKKTKNFQ